MRWQELTRGEAEVVLAVKSLKSVQTGARLVMAAAGVVGAAKAPAAARKVMVRNFILFGDAVRWR